MDKDKKKEADLLDPVIDLVAKTDHMPYGVIEGVSADALDLAQTASRANRVKKALEERSKLGKLLQKTVTDGPAPTIPLRQARPTTVTIGRLARDEMGRLREPTTVSLKPNQIPKGQILKNAAKTFKAAVKKNPIVSPLVMGYETAAILTSEKARRDAINQAEDMAERSAAGEDAPWHGYGGGAAEIAKNMAKNGLQGFLDPVGTIFATLRHGKRTVKRSGD